MEAQLFFLNFQFEQFQFDVNVVLWSILARYPHFVHPLHSPSGPRYTFLLHEVLINNFLWGSGQRPMAQVARLSVNNRLCSTLGRLHSIAVRYTWGDVESKKMKGGQFALYCRREKRELVQWKIWKMQSENELHYFKSRIQRAPAIYTSKRHYNKYNTGGKIQ